MSGLGKVEMEGTVNAFTLFSDAYNAVPDNGIIYLCNDFTESSGKYYIGVTSYEPNNVDKNILITSYGDSTNNRHTMSISGLIMSGDSSVLLENVIISSPRPFQMYSGTLTVGKDAILKGIIDDEGKNGYGIIAREGTIKVIQNAEVSGEVVGLTTIAGVAVVVQDEAIIDVDSAPLI